MYLICWGTEVVAAVLLSEKSCYAGNLLRLRSAVFKPLYTTRATEKALGHQRQFDPLCLEELLYSILVALVTLPESTNALLSMMLSRAQFSIALICFILSSNNVKSVEKDADTYCGVICNSNFDDFYDLTRQWFFI